MPGPFPGMDPYLEDPAIFPDLHDSLIAYLREALNAQLPPPYYATINARVWVEPSRRFVEPDVDVLRPNRPVNGSGTRAAGAGGVAVSTAVATEPVVVHAPREEIRERFLEVRARRGNERLVVTIEVLSLSNKTPGAHGRGLYLQKQNEVLGGEVNLVEIDLLRAGVHTTAVPLDAAVERTGGSDYHVCVRQFDRPDDFFVYPVRLPQRLPTIAVPLLPDDPPPQIDLQALLDRSYDTGLYDRRVRYREDRPVPPLSPEQQTWADQILRSRGLVGGDSVSPPVP